MGLLTNNINLSDHDIEMINDFRDKHNINLLECLSYQALQQLINYNSFNVEALHQLLSDGLTDMSLIDKVLTYKPKELTSSKFKLVALCQPELMSSLIDKYKDQTSLKSSNLMYCEVFPNHDAGLTKLHRHQDNIIEYFNNHYPHLVDDMHNYGWLVKSTHAMRMIALSVVNFDKQTTHDLMELLNDEDDAFYSIVIGELILATALGLDFSKMKRLIDEFNYDCRLLYGDEIRCHEYASLARHILHTNSTQWKNAIMKRLSFNKHADQLLKQAECLFTELERLRKV